MMWSSTISTSATVLMISRCPGDQTRNDCNQVSVRAASESLRVVFVLSVVGNDSNLLIVFYVQIMPDDFVMQ
ncbi:hypothetical protein, partial [Shigella sonnei]|uniref:hypothetical protein n=1 Tax=Shigella sonnei TaxID=624 RepID=UPI002093DF46